MGVLCVVCMLCVILMDSNEMNVDGQSKSQNRLWVSGEHKGSD